ncbi:flagellar assembly protein FliW [Desulfomarina sp.]
MTISGAVSDKNEVDSEKILTFPQGIPGFEKYTTYLLFHKEENDFSAYWLESCDSPKVTFTLVDPGQYGISYQLELTEKEQELLGAASPADLGVFLILSKHEEGENRPAGLHANIAGPVIINPQNRLGLQKVIEKSSVNAIITEKRD